MSRSGTGRLSAWSHTIQLLLLELDRFGWLSRYVRNYILLFQLPLASILFLDRVEEILTLTGGFANYGIYISACQDVLQPNLDSLRIVNGSEYLVRWMWSGDP